MRDEERDEEEKQGENILTSKYDRASSENEQSSENFSAREEIFDNVMKLPGELYMSETKVIESKTVCYCSNFDINVNDWFNEYENIEIFKINVNKNLGKQTLSSSDPLCFYCYLL